jgi:ribosome recycling factor
MIEDILKDTKTKMARAVDSIATQLSKIRTGRAHPSLLEGVMVSFYGQATPLKGAASITIEDARTLLITPYQKDMIGAIEKAILTSDLGLNPSSAGTTIRVPLPPLTEERRRDLTKIVKQETEQGRVAIRNLRRDARAKLKDLHKAKSLTDDELKKAEDKIQKLTDEHITQSDKMMTEKEHDLMTL